MLLLGNIRSIMRGCIRIDNVFFRKPTRPSLPLRKAPPLISVFFNGLYTPFGSPVSGGQKPQGRRGKPPSGAQNRYALRLADQSGLASCVGWDRLGKTGGRWFFLTHSNMFEVDICGFVIRSFHFLGKLLQ